MPTRSLGFQSFYQAQLTSSISDTDLTIPLDVLPTPSEGILVIESTSSTKREIIYYTSKTASAVVCPSGAGNGRGYDGTTASSHLANSAVIMAPVAQMFKSLQDGSSMSSTVSLQNVTVSGSLTVGGQTPTADWSNLASAPNTVAANGNRSYTLTFNGVDYTGTIQPGTRVRTTRTVAAPTQCTFLNGTTQYFNKTSPTGITFTSTFTAMAWVKLAGYQSGAIIGRDSATGTAAGWEFNVDNNGSVGIYGRNAVGYVEGRSYQSLPLGKWVHVAASLNAATGACVIYIDGVVVANSITVSGGATSIVQASTDLTIGKRNSAASYFSGKIAQAAIFSSVLTQATITSTYNQGLAGNETSLISAYSFSNNINDLNATNANNLTGQGVGVNATNADSPFSQNGQGDPTGTYDYGIVQNRIFSTNTTVVVQVPEGNTIPVTSGGVSALAYSTNKVPYGMPISTNKWEVLTIGKSTANTNGPVANTWYNPGLLSLKVPVGYWRLGYNGKFDSDRAAAGPINIYSSLSTSNSSQTDSTFTAAASLNSSSSVSNNPSIYNEVYVSSITQYYLIVLTTETSITNVYVTAAQGATKISAIPGNL